MVITVCQTFLGPRHGLQRIIHITIDIEIAAHFVPDAEFDMDDETDDLLFGSTSVTDVTSSSSSFSFSVVHDSILVGVVVDSVFVLGKLPF